MASFITLLGSFIGLNRGPGLLENSFLFLPELVIVEVLLPALLSFPPVLIPLVLPIFSPITNFTHKKQRIHHG